MNPFKWLLRRFGIGAKEVEPEPTYQEMLDDLKERGWRVRFEHYRPCIFLSWIREVSQTVYCQSKPVRYSRKFGFHKSDFVRYNPTACGGETHCLIERDGVFIRSIADCRPDENFCYQTGREVSLARAYEQAIKYQEEN